MKDRNLSSTITEAEKSNVSEPAVCDEGLLAAQLSFHCNLLWWNEQQTPLEPSLKGTYIIYDGFAFGTYIVTSQKPHIPIPLS